MTTRRSTSLRRRLRIWRSLGADADGTAAFEFVYVLPVLVFLWLAGTEVTRAISVDNKISQAAVSAGELASHASVLTNAEIENIFNAVEGAVHPNPAEKADLILTAVNVDGDGQAQVLWSRARGRKDAHAKGADVSALIDPQLRRPNTQIIMSEAFYPYRPAVGYVVTGTVEIDERSFHMPRGGSAIQLCAGHRMPRICE
jgi:Flp pilus assembly protein TadG